MQIVTAQRSDLPFLAALRNEAQSVRLSKRGLLSLEQIEEDYFDRPDKRSFVAHHEGRAAGYVIFENLGTGRLEISVALVPDRRGEGLGTELIRAATAHGLDACGADTIVAIVLSGNEASARAFARAGYRLVSEDDKQRVFEAARL